MKKSSGIFLCPESNHARGIQLPPGVLATFHAAACAAHGFAAQAGFSVRRDAAAPGFRIETFPFADKPKRRFVDKIIAWCDWKIKGICHYFVEYKRIFYFGNFENRFHKLRKRGHMPRFYFNRSDLFVKDQRDPFNGFFAGATDSVPLSGRAYKEEPHRSIEVPPTC
ncbi:MAG: hypothetical protein ACI4OL_00045 [Gemmiger sp.]